MTKKLTSAVLVTALLMSGAVVGVGYASGVGSTQPAVLEEPTVIDLNWNTRGEGSLVEYFASDPSAGRCTDSDPICLQITLKEMPIFDQDGTQVGRQHIQCTVGWHLKRVYSVDWFCSYVTQLQDGPYTDHGQLTGVGVKRPNGDVLVSITGGTGAYEDAGGYIVQAGDTGKVTFSIHLTP